MKALMLVLVAFLAIVAYAVISVFRKRAAEAEAVDDKPWPFYSKRPLSQPEQVLYHRLVAALPEHIVLAQVQLSRVMGVKKGFGARGWLNRINRMSFDFVVCLKDSTVVAAIELNDRSHESAIGSRRTSRNLAQRAPPVSASCVGMSKGCRTATIFVRLSSPAEVDR